MGEHMTPRERVSAALKGEPVDRVPLCFWHHFNPEGSGERLAEQTLHFFHDTFHLDIIKIMPDIPYPGPEQPFLEARQIRFLPRLDVDTTPEFQQQLLCIRKIRAEVGPDYPIILTLFSPLTYLMFFFGPPHARTINIARSDPQVFEEGLGTLAANLRKLMEAAIDAGADGIFYSCMGATTADFTLDEYKELGWRYDLQALRGAEKGWLNIAHIHADPQQSSDQIYFEFFDRYPVQALSWSDRLTGPSLSEALTLTDKCLMGGLFERGPITQGGETEITNEIMAAITQTKGRRLILANGCSVPDDTPERWLQFARSQVDSLQH
uniref:Uroporphyrinogen decarboxylase n=1 Tax=Thermosporothrix sp. COM3 TaxID=2490863 RepID=A0A455T0P4_9CHLR|nr:uroporphyrinogen decarboxylase [Thermosporothrix sp. COM3]